MELKGTLGIVLSNVLLWQNKVQRPGAVSPHRHWVNIRDRSGFFTHFSSLEKLDACHTQERRSSDIYQMIEFICFPWVCR